MSTKLICQITNVRAGKAGLDKDLPLDVLGDIVGSLDAPSSFMEVTPDMQNSSS